MTPERASNAIWASLSLIGLVYLIFWGTRGLAVDWFRDQMFKLRDEFFDAASDGLIDFNHPAYGTLRIMMNGLIRYCHKLSLLNVLLLTKVFSTPQDVKDVGLFSHNWGKATKDLDANTLRKLEDFRSRLQVLVLAYIIISSPFIAILLFIFLLLGFAVNSIGRYFFNILRRWASGIRNSGRVKEFLRDIDDTAYAGGDI